MMDEDNRKLRDSLMPALLAHVPFDGWSATALRRAAEDCGVDQKPDPVVAQQSDDDKSFERLLEGGCDISRIGHELDAGKIEPEQADRVAECRSTAAKHDNRQYEPDRHELVAVQVDQCRKEAAYGQQPEQQVNQQVRRHIILSEIMNSSSSKSFSP